MLEWQEVSVRLALAALFGALIGLERERKNWTAGMRTHMMVCVGAALTMLVSAYGFSDVLGRDHVVLDPARVAAQVISGIGFIGAGTILFSRQGTIRGLTTASGLWTVAAIGLATGGGMYFAAGAATLLALIILWVLQPFERKITRRFRQHTLTIEITAEADIAEVLKKIEAVATGIPNFSIERSGQGTLIQLSLGYLDEERSRRITELFHNDPSVKLIVWNKK